MTVSLLTRFGDRPNLNYRHNLLNHIGIWRQLSTLAVVLMFRREDFDIEADRGEVQVDGQRQRQRTIGKHDWHSNMMARREDVEAAGRRGRETSRRAKRERHRVQEGANRRGTASTHGGSGEGFVVAPSTAPSPSKPPARSFARTSRFGL